MEGAIVRQVGGWSQRRKAAAASDSESTVRPWMLSFRPMLGVRRRRIGPPAVPAATVVQGESDGTVGAGEESEQAGHSKTRRRTTAQHTAVHGWLSASRGDGPNEEQPLCTSQVQFLQDSDSIHTDTLYNHGFMHFARTARSSSRSRHAPRVKNWPSHPVGLSLFPVWTCGAVGWWTGGCADDVARCVLRCTALCCCCCLLVRRSADPPAALPLGVAVAVGRTGPPGVGRACRCGVISGQRRRHASSQQQHSDDADGRAGEGTDRGTGIEA